MPGCLKQSTASQSRALGPFLDDTDFKTPETALTINNTDIKLVVNGGASANKNSGGGTHRVNGVYGMTFDATDTATVGEMEVSVVVSGALPVFDKFFVVEEAVYDALFAASAPGYLQPTTAGRTLDVSAGGEAGVDWANVGTPGSTVSLSATTVATVTTATTASALMTNNDKTGYRLSATGVDDVWDEALSGHTTAGTAGLALAEAGTTAIQKNTALANFMFPMYDSTTKEPKTGLVVASITKYESIDGAAPVALTGAITEVSAANMPGIYAISLTAGETNGRVLSLRFAATGCDSTILTLITND